MGKVPSKPTSNEICDAAISFFALQLAAREWRSVKINLRTFGCNMVTCSIPWSLSNSRIVTGELIGMRNAR